MPTIVVQNSTTTIKNVSPQLEKQLRVLLSYVSDEKAAYFSGSFGPRRIPLINKKGEFPTGLLFRLLGYLKQSNIAFKFQDLRKPPTGNKPYSLLSPQLPYLHQSEAVDSAVKAGRGCVSLPTGSGKTFVIALIASRLGAKTLVVVPTLELKNQLTEVFKTLIPKDKVVVVENIASPNLNNLTDFDCLVIDEAHHSASKTYRKHNKTSWANIYHRFFLTATPFRSNENENVLFESVTGKVIYTLDYKTAVKANYIVPVEAYYIEIPKQQTDAFSWAEVYNTLVVKNVSRNFIIASLLSNLDSKEISTLCLVKEIEHGKELSNITGISFASGQTEGSRDYISDFNSCKIDALIGTTGVIGEGVDTKPCEFVVIAGLGKAKSQFMQQVGRAVRTYPGKETAKIIIFKDRSHKFLLRHFKAQCVILKEEYGIIPEKLDIEDLK